MKRLLSILGPGIFAIGYTIGTGSVTSMAKAGSQYGLQLVWVLFLSCLFSGVLMEAYGRMAVVTGETALHAVKRHLPFGRTLALLILAGVATAQYTCLGGILTLSSGAIYETLGMFFPALPKESYAATLGIAAVLIGAICGLLMIGRYSFFDSLVNRPALLGKHRAGFALNAGLVLALLFSCVIAVTGALALWRQFAH